MARSLYVTFITMFMVSLSCSYSQIAQVVCLPINARKLCVSVQRALDELLHKYFAITKMNWKLKEYMVNWNLFFLTELEYSMYNNFKCVSLMHVVRLTLVLFYCWVLEFLLPLFFTMFGITVMILILLISEKTKHKSDNNKTVYL